MGRDLYVRGARGPTQVRVGKRGLLAADMDPIHSLAWPWFGLALAGCGLEGPRVLRLSLATAQLTAEAGARVDLPVEVEARRVWATLRVEGLPEGFAPPPMALEEGRRTLTLPLLAKEAGTYSARVVAEGEGLIRTPPRSLC